MSLEQGMDVARVRDVAQQLLASGERIAAVGATGRSQLSVLGGAWEGADVEHFEGGWSTAEQTISDASTRIRAYSRLLTEQADQQDHASDGSGSILSGGAGTPGGTGAGPGRGGSSSDDGFGLDDLAALGPLGSGIAALATKGPRLWAALTGNTFKMYQALMPEGRLASLLGASGGMMDDLFRATVPARISSRLGGLLRATGPTLGKFLGPAGVIAGGFDLVQGVREGDYLRATGGGLGALSGGLATAAAFGVALGPVGIGIMAGAGIAAAGIAIYQNWDSISGALTDAGGAIADGARDIADGARDIADGVGSVLSDPVGAIGGLFS